MMIRALNLQSTIIPNSLAGKFFQFPLVRMIMAILLLSAFLFAVDSLVNYLISGVEGPAATIFKYGKSILIIITCYYAYRLYVFHFEKRPVYELSFSASLTETVAGIVVGASMIALVVVILIVPGYYKIIEFNSINLLAKGFFIFSEGAFFEEVLFRLIIFKLVEEFLGSWLSIIVSAFLFGLAHIFNVNATLWSAIAISVEAGVLLAVAFMLTRRIWLVLGIHFGWNFAQASVFGIPTSGIDFNGLISPEITGPTWLTGGSFGVEASVITLILGILTAMILLRMTVRDGQIVNPAWKRGRKAEIIY